MVTTVKTWTSSLNRTLGSTTNQSTQYANFMYEWSNQFIQAGWTHVRSCNSSALDTGTNLWTSASAVVHGLSSSSQARSFIILQSPTGWGSPSSGSFYLALDCQSTNANSVPQTCSVFFASSLITATTTTAALTVPNNAHHAFSLTQVFGWSGAAAARASFWRTSSGDVIWYTKLVSDSQFTRGGHVTDPTNARGNWRGIIGMSGLTTPIVSTPFGSGGTIGLTSTGATSGSSGYPVTFVSPAHSLTSWTSAIAGADHDGSVMFTQAIGGTNQSTQANRRYYGTIPDIWFTQSATFNLSDTSDTDATVLRGFNYVALPVPTGTGALE